MEQANTFEIHLNETLVAAFENTDARVFTNVNVYAGDPWYEPLDGMIRNIEITTSPGNMCVSVN